MKRVAVVGGGAAGVLTVVHLARQLPVDAPVEVVLFDDSGRLGRGPAYATTDRRHLLNVPAARMSAASDDAEHFVRWLQRDDPAATGEDYRPRSDYGNYLAQCLAKHARACRLVVRHARVGDVTRLGSRWWLAHERGVDVVDAVVLAIGHAPPAAVSTAGVDAQHVVEDPWAPGALDGLMMRTGLGDLVVTVGTGLTAVDVALTLIPAGRRVLAVSRHGLLPASQRPQATTPVPLVVPAEPRVLTVSALVSIVRAHIDAVVAAGGDWRAAVDGTRSVTAELWRRLPATERAAFLAGPARRWETVRHRMAPAVAAEITQYRQDGRLVITRGRLSGVAAAAVVNCTGPTTDIDCYPGGFGRKLLERGLVRRDRLGLGIETTADGRVIDAAGHTEQTFVAVGALRRGALYESTAIPELRAQAEAVSATVIADLMASLDLRERAVERSFPPRPTLEVG